MFEDRPGDRARRRQLPGHPAAPPHGRQRDPPRARLRPPDARRPRHRRRRSDAPRCCSPGWWPRRAPPGLHPRRLPFRSDNGEPPPRRDWDGDRIALVAATLIAIVFGLQSAIDWTWFVPGPTAMALVAAGFVAGPRPARPAGAGERPLATATPARLLAASGVLLAAILMAWAIWQPEASDRETADAIRLADAGDVDAAIAKTEDAADTNPLSSDPLLTRAAIETEAGPRGRRPRGARAGGAQVPRRPPDLVPAGGVPAGHARPARARRPPPCRARSSSTRARAPPGCSSSRRGRAPASRPARPASGAPAPAAFAGGGAASRPRSRARPARVAASGA